MSNVCTEEIVHALALMGYDTGVDLPRLLAAGSIQDFDIF